MADNKERSEDLNPQSSDIEEKVKQMLDPRIPDETLPTGKSNIKIISEEDAATTNDAEPVEIPALKPATGKKLKIVDASDADDSASKEVAASTAPELPGAADPEIEEPQKPIKQSRKVIVPITHDNENTAIEASASEERKIEVLEHGDSGEVAEKLDQAIAELEPEDLENTEDAEESTEFDAEQDDQDAVAEDEPEVAPVSSPKPVPVKPKEVTKQTTKVVEKRSESKLIDNPDTDKAVKDIIAKEGDTLLDTLPSAKTDVKPEAEKKEKKKGLFRRVLTSKPVRWLLILTILAGLGYVGAVPKYRYTVLNKLGVRSTSSIFVRDITTNQPLADVTVTIAGKEAKTNQDGYAQVSDLLLGPADLKIEKIAFEPVAEDITIGWGSNPLGDRLLTPTGIQYKITALDFLSEKGVKGARASFQASSAQADENGVITLTIPDTQQDTVEITLSASDYREQKVKIPKESSDIPVQKLVPSQKHVYVNKSSGNYDIYSSYIDGKDKKVVLKASGYEEDDLVLLPHYAKNRAAYVSTRTNNRNDAGQLTNNLLIINLEDNEVANLGSADRIQLVGWYGDYLTYVTVNSADQTANRSKLMSYNLSDGKTKELAKSNVFNDVMIAGDKVYFAPSSLVSGGDEAKLFAVKVNGNDRQKIIDTEIWKLFRNSYKNLALSAQDDWYRHVIGSSSASDLDDATSNRMNRLYINNPGDTKAAWVDQRDGEGVIVLYDIKGDKDQTLLSEVGIDYPVFWLNKDTLIYRTDNGGDVVDFAVSINGGKPVKVTDVSATNNTDNWYYF